MIEVSSNLFVGNIPPQVVDNLTTKIDVSAVQSTLVREDKSMELGISVSILNCSERQVADFDGLELVSVKTRFKAKT